METLGYLHLACANESLGDSRPFAARNSELFKGLSLRNLPSVVWVKFLSIAVSLTILSIANAAMALLQEGDQGSEVSTLQTQLTAAGCYDGPVTGVFGSLTKEGVIRCQQRNGLVVDGIVGPATQASLQRASGTQTVSQYDTLTVDQTFDQTFDAPTGQTVYTTGETLRLGSRGPAVSDLQNRLSALGYDSGSVDGIFGQQTEDAVTRFQRDRNLSVDGVVGTQVYQALNGDAPTANYSTPLSPTAARLTIGDTGARVESLQRRLKSLGYFDSSETGYYGSLTQAAVSRFQADRRLPTTGVADARTLSALGINTAGRDPINRYIVVVPKQNANTLTQVKQFVPSAFEEKSRLGDYVQAGAYPSPERADRQTKLLRARGLDARVAYR